MTSPLRPVPFIERVRVKNFRSIADCDVTFGPLTVLVGLNASGKSNFVDALKFVVDAVSTSLPRAISDRGGIDALLHRAADPIESFSIELHMEHWSYLIEVGRGELPLRGEVLEWRTEERVEKSEPLPEPSENLALAGDKFFYRFFRDLRACRFYDLDTAVLRAIDEETHSRRSLGPSGQHLGQVLGALDRDHPQVKERLDSYLAAVIANALGVDEQREGRYSTVSARFLSSGDPHLVHSSKRFLRESLSEGTLRAAGVLAALFQPPVLDDEIPLVVVEESEKALHPATVSSLYEALTDAAERTQVIVTTQSSDLLESEYVELEHIRAVANVDGITYVGPVDEEGSALVDRKLMAIGELHRSGQMMPAINRPAE